MAEVNAQAEANTADVQEKPTENVEQKETPTESKQADQKQKEPSVQELMVELARMKRAVDKASSEAAEYKKKYNSTLSEKEIADQAKAEAEAKREDEFKELQRKVKVNDLTNSFLKLGYGDAAEKAAIAQADNDTDALFKIQAEVDAAKKKAWEAEFYKNRPQPQAGVSGEKPTMTKEDFQNLMKSGKYMEIIDFKNKYPATYAEYTKH